MRPCKGCTDNGMCTLQTKGSIAINECPCQKCLVKGICKEPCEAITQHYENVSSMPTKPNIVKVIHMKGKDIE